MTAAVQRAWTGARIPRGAAWLGAIAPDLPLYLLSGSAWVYYRVVRGWTSQRAFEHMFGDLYFHDPIWVGLHNLLHAPFVLVAGMVGARLLLARHPAAARWLSWFLAACALHSAVDFVTHYDDGPLPFFPFDWRHRFQGPVSYWDVKHYAGQFARFEWGLDLALLAYLVMGWIRRRGETAAPGGS